MTTKKHKRPSEMFPLIEKYLDSNLTQKQFCASQFLKNSVFQYWLKKYRQNSNTLLQSNDFVSLEIEPKSISDPSNAHTAILRFANGNELHFPWS